jgi:hypothetical protein
MTQQSVDLRKSRRMRAVRQRETDIVNGKKAKALRKIARGLKLPPENKYEPVGPIRRREAIKDHGRSYTAGIVRRPFALSACERRAYQEAKALYAGEHLKVDALHAPEAPAAVPVPARPFKDQVFESIKQQPEAPVYGPEER